MDVYNSRKRLYDCNIHYKSSLSWINGISNTSSFEAHMFEIQKQKMPTKYVMSTMDRNVGKAVKYDNCFKRCGIHSEDNTHIYK